MQGTVDRSSLEREEWEAGTRAGRFTDVKGAELGRGFRLSPCHLSESEELIYLCFNLLICSFLNLNLSVSLPSLSVGPPPSCCKDEVN